MILTTHAVAGAAVASLNPTRPISGFFAGFILHFILDAIPHWEYKIKSGFVDPRVGSRFTTDRAFFLDVLRIGSDLSLGIILSFALFYSQTSLLVILAGVFGGVAPDALQFIYGRTRKRPIGYSPSSANRANFILFALRTARFLLRGLQKFHGWIHSPYLKLRKMPILGIPLQALILLLIIFAALVA